MKIGMSSPGGGNDAWDSGQTIAGYAIMILAFKSSYPGGVNDALDSGKPYPGGWNLAWESVETLPQGWNLARNSVGTLPWWEYYALKPVWTLPPWEFRAWESVGTLPRGVKPCLRFSSDFHPVGYDMPEIWFGPNSCIFFLGIFIFYCYLCKR